MSKANALSTFGTKPTFSSADRKKAAMAGESLAGLSFSAVISVSSLAAILAARRGLACLVASARRLATDLVGLRIAVISR